jgi:hypothetical protein
MNVGKERTQKKEDKEVKEEEEEEEEEKERESGLLNHKSENATSCNACLLT